MPLVTVKPEFQVTIPAKLRRGIHPREGVSWKPLSQEPASCFVPWR